MVFFSRDENAADTPQREVTARHEHKACRVCARAAAAAATTVADRLADGSRRIALDGGGGGRSRRCQLWRNGFAGRTAAVVGVARVRHFVRVRLRRPAKSARPRTHRFGSQGCHTDDIFVSPECRATVLFTAVRVALGRNENVTRMRAWPYVTAETVLRPLRYRVSGLRNRTAENTANKL